TKVQCEGWCNAPVILTVSREGPRKLVPCRTGQVSLAGCFWVAEEEIGSRIARESASKQNGAVSAAVAGVEGVDTIPPHLESRLDDVLAARNHQPVAELDNRVSKILIHD